MYRAPDPQLAGLRQLAGPQGASGGPEADLHAANVEAALATLDAFEQGPWGQRFPTVAAAWRRAWSHVIPFFPFPPQIRRMIYDQCDESAHAQLRKIITKGAA